jgi:hypothetical protein
MTDQEKLDRDALCDQLMKEGIAGRSDADAVRIAGTLTSTAMTLERKDALACACAWYETLEKKVGSGKLAILIDYNRANAISGERRGTQWQWEQRTLAREIFYLRRAVGHEKFGQVSETFRCMCLNNLGSRLRTAGRIIEALDYFRRTLEVEPRFGMSMCNRARMLYSYAGALEDDGHRTLFLWMAHKEASAALAPTAIYTNAHDELTKLKVRETKEWIESVLDVEGMSKANPLVSEDVAASEEEREYRRWCLHNCLYLNPLNDLGRYSVADNDALVLATHIVPVGAPHVFESFFDEMKQEYVSARWLLYEGLSARTPHFSDREVFLLATDPRPSLCLAIEKVKSAYRVSYSIFDKVAFFINEYMTLGIKEKDVSFRRLWRESENKPIRREFDSTENWGSCALYWLAKDLFEQENDEVAEPQARGLCTIRNHLEHKYLRVTEAEGPLAPPEDLAFMVSRKEFEKKTVHLLRLARSALIYLVIGVRWIPHFVRDDKMGG